MWKRFAHLSTVVSRTKLQWSDPAALKQVNTFCSDASKDVFIVYLGKIKHKDPELVIASHHELLTPLFGSKEEAVRSILHHYKYAFSGFAASLTRSQAQSLADMPGVMHVSGNFKYYVERASDGRLDPLEFGFNFHSKASVNAHYRRYTEEEILEIIDSGANGNNRGLEYEYLDPAALKQVNTFCSDASKETFIVYLGDKKHDDPELVVASHIELLTPLFGSKEEAVDSVVCHYKHSFSGFAARLTWSQAHSLAEMPGVVNVRRNFKYHFCHKSHSLGLLHFGHNSLSETLPQKGNYENHGEEKIIEVGNSGTKSYAKNPYTKKT